MRPLYSFLYATALLPFLAAVISVGAADGVSADPVSTLPVEMQEIMALPKYHGARWGIYVIDRDSGQVVYDVNGSQFIVPGSTAKLFSTATALDTYGPDFRFETPVYRTGPINAQG